VPRAKRLEDGGSVVAITQKFLRNLKPPKTGRKEYFSDTLPAFGLRVSHTGHASYFLLMRKRYEVMVTRWTIGTTAQYSPEEAWKVAQGWIQDIREGRDPKPKAAAAPADTVAALVPVFVKRHLKESAPKSWDRVEARINNHVVPAWGKRPIASITKKDAFEWRDNLMDTGLGAGTRNIFLARQRDYIAISPFDDVPLPPQGEARERVLTDAELVAVYKAAEALGPKPCAYIRALILTGQRREEVASMRWGDIDADLWTIPREDMKGRRAHTVPLTPQALAVIATQPRVGKNPHVFPGDRGDVTHMKNYGDLKARLDKAAPGVAHWTLHDARRTCITGMTSLGVSSDIAGRVVAHAQAGVTNRVYNQHDYLAERRAALTLWSDHVAALVAGKA
jgi:integrase